VSSFVILAALVLEITCG